MEIHKPKPWHSFREFLKEYLIIVVGVLTALGAEQIAENLHWQHLLHEERAALNEDAARVYGAMHGRVDMQPCVDARLADIATILRRHDLGQPIGLTGPVGRPSFTGETMNAFDMAIADQGFSHMPIAEKQSYFRMRSTFETFIRTRDLEIDAWRTLRTLDRVHTFTSDDWAEVRKANDRAVDANQVFKTNLKSERTGQWFFPFRALPQPPRSPLMQIPWVVQLCSPSIVR